MLAFVNVTPLKSMAPKSPFGNSPRCAEVEEHEVGLVVRLVRGEGAAGRAGDVLQSSQGRAVHVERLNRCGRCRGQRRASGKAHQHGSEREEPEELANDHVDLPVAEFGNSLLPELRVVLRLRRRVPGLPVTRYRPEGVFDGDCGRYCAKTSQPR